MKTAISLPDQLFDLAEIAAKKLRVSRSELYARALADFLERADSRKVTDRLNSIYMTAPATVEPALRRAQRKSLNKGAW